ncbi:hypothetical protein EV646_106366 [Kribbella antiqua]|uniref:MmcQ/YjbR family DNA-binding protein n=1 Tax=Kribbella antiqua TaxID=2512217 RepID=A0A4R2IRX3_9ACTN|nr:hypothetical protein [Kribbella antiqua]TCO47126.1 hypothetical protein EV646_106366 [Kribbella antiqua]
MSEIARTLDGVKESRAKGLLRWTLDGRMVARQYDDESIVIRIDFAERERLLAAHPDLFFVPPRFDAHQKVVLRLADADPAVVKSALVAAWNLQRAAD